MNCDVAVLGAGLAGIAAAKVLDSQGHSYVILEKSRGIGGRAATRRIEGIPVDQGAQFFTARTPVFQSKIAEWMDAGVCREWSRGFPVWNSGGLRYLPDGHPRYSCPAGMTALTKYEARGIDVQREQTVVSVETDTAGYVLQTKQGLEIRAKAVLTTAPAPQTLALFGHLMEPEAMQNLRNLKYAPCFTAVFAGETYAPEWDAVVVENEDIGWIAADGSKRDTAGAGPFVVHGSQSFSREHLEEDAADVAALMLETAVKITHGGLAGAPLLFAHRWRYAMVENPLPEVFLNLSQAPPLVFAGDAFLQANLESAWFSGQSAGFALSSALGCIR